LWNEKTLELLDEVIERELYLTLQHSRPWEFAGSDFVWTGHGVLRW